MRSLLALAVLVVALAAPAAAEACSLMYQAPDARVQAADVAVFGKVVERTVTEGSTEGAWDAEYRYRLRVTRGYKGVRAGRVIEITGSANDAMCGVGLLEVGAKQGFVLRGRRGPWQATLASRISRAELARGSRATRRRG